MTNDSSLSLPELERRIAIARDNIRQLIEQAAANSGAGDESRNADRVAQQKTSLVFENKSWLPIPWLVGRRHLFPLCIDFANNVVFKRVIEGQLTSEFVQR